MSWPLTKVGTRAVAKDIAVKSVNRPMEDLNCRSVLDFVDRTNDWSDIKLAISFHEPGDNVVGMASFS